jgi:hypothetical protein
MPLHVSSICDVLDGLDVGDQIGRYLYITDLNGVPTDTTDVTFELRLPDKTVVNADITHPEVGTYLATLPVFADGGVYRWKATAAGLVNQVQQGSFRVRPAVL